MTFSLKMISQEQNTSTVSPLRRPRLFEPSVGSLNSGDPIFCNRSRRDRWKCLIRWGSSHELALPAFLRGVVFLCSLGKSQDILVWSRQRCVTPLLGYLIAEGPQIFDGLVLRTYLQILLPHLERCGHVSLLSSSTEKSMAANISL